MSTLSYTLGHGTFSLACRSMTILLAFLVVMVLVLAESP